MPFTATAFICVYNEADILPFVVRHLIEQEIGVHIIDNWSTDDSAEIAQSFSLKGFERFPEYGPSPYYSWKPLLERVEELTYRSKTVWSVHQDADEIRRSPRAGESLLDGLARTTEAGYNAIDHNVFHFFPVDDTYDGEPENHFRYYSPEHDPENSQVKAWRNSNNKVNLSESGGHSVDFPGRSVSPERFILKHYPVRSAEQGERKVLTERINRYDPAELSIGWHVQYGQLAVKQNWIQRPEDLVLWT